MALGKVEIGAICTYPEGYRCVTVWQVWKRVWGDG